ncbi:MAG: hypothetical protein LBD37_08220 [Treponema sp.]|jgi:hypothetical protein|nr:hypothetical protein [Treponema sp.]
MRKRQYHGIPAAWALAALMALSLSACNTGGDPDEPGGGGQDKPSGGGEDLKPPVVWTKADSGTSQTINKAAYGNGIFVATGANGYAGWSADGITWHEASQKAALGTSNMHVYFGKDYFIATGGSSTNKDWAYSADGDVWTATGSSDANFNAKGGVYGSVYLVSGSAGRIAHNTSASGTWTALDSAKTTFTATGAGGFINALAYGNNVYVAGGGSGHAAWAADPTGNWTGASTATGKSPEVIFDSGFINALIFADGRFIAAGGLDSGTGKAAYSTDGNEWTQSNPIQIGDNKMVSALGYGNGVFVITDTAGNASYSTDKGASWTKIENTQFNGDAAAINSVCYGGGTFVMAGSNGRIAYASPESAVQPQTPKTPKTWTKVDLANASINKIAFGNGVFVAVGINGYAAWSSDGKTWTQASNKEALGTSNMHVYFGNGAFIATGGSSNNKNWAYSTDGKTWTATGSNDANFNAKGGVYGSVYLVSGSAGRIAYSTSASGTWTTLPGEKTTFTATGSSGFINALAYGNNRYVAGGGSGHAAWADDPAGQWTGASAATGKSPEVIFDSGFINALIFAEGRFIAAGGKDDGTGKAAYSTDGSEWTQSGPIRIGDGKMVSALGYGKGVLVLADTAGNASYSTDRGATWTKIENTQFNGDTTAINAVCYGKGLFVMGGPNRIAYAALE